MKSVAPRQDRPAAVRAGRGAVRHAPCHEADCIRETHLIWPGNLRSPHAIPFLAPGPRGDAYDTCRRCRAISGRPGEGLTFPQGNPESEKYTKYNIFHKEENDISG
jgi:hypothetical protein